MIRQVLLGNILLGVQYVVGGLLPIVLIPHIVRTIGLSTYGNLATALAWASYGAVLVQFAFQYTGPRRLAQLEPGETARGVFRDIGYAKGLLLIPAAIAMVAVGIAQARGPSATAQWVLLVLLPLGACLHTGWHLQSAGRFLSLCATSIVGAAAALLTGFLFVRRAESSSIVGASLALGIGPFLAGVGTLTASLLLLRNTPAPARKAAPMLVLRQGWPLFIAQFTSALYSVSGPLVIRYASGAEAAGAYSTVERIVNALLGACLLTHTAAYPRLCALYDSNRVGYLGLMRFVVLAYWACTLVIIATVLVTRDSLMRYLFGPVAPQGAELLLACALAWLATGVLGTSITGYLTISGRQGEVWALTLKVLGLSLVIGVPGSFFLGAWAWMAALVLGQTPVIIASARAWRLELEHEKYHGI